MAELRFYLDENLPTAISDQLVSRSIEAVSVRSLGRLAYSDENHLIYTAEQRYVLCTYDSDYLTLAKAFDHSGIIIGVQIKHRIGDWVKGLTLYHAVYTFDEMRNRVEFP